MPSRKYVTPERPPDRSLTSAPVLLQRLVSPETPSPSPSPGPGHDFGRIAVQSPVTSGTAPAAALRHAMQGRAGDLPHRSSIEAATGRSFAAVRSYTGPQALEACAAVGARAFTVQNVTVFAEPSPPLHVSLHEAVHVIQQRGDRNVMSTPPSTLDVARPADATEREAHGIVSAAAAHGEHAEPAVHGRSQLDGFFWLSGCSDGCSRDQAPPPPKEDAGTPPEPAGPIGVKEVDKNGWLKVKVGEAVTQLPWYLQVKVSGRSNGRDQFTISEGQKKGQAASVVQKSATESYLGPMTYGGPAAVVLEKGAEKLTYGSNTGISAFTDPANPLPDGTHDIQLPDEPHHLADSYLTDSPYATTWFRLGTSGDRYLHPGLHSAGCSTVRDTKKWTDIYRYLISSRKSDTAHGTLTVKP